MASEVARNCCSELFSALSITPWGNPAYDFPLSALSLQDVAGERHMLPAMRRVGVPALLDGNVGEQILEGAGARFVGSDALGNRSGTVVAGCTPLGHLACPVAERGV